MSYSATPTLLSLYTALGGFITDVTGLPTGSVIRGLANRTSMPKPGFVLMQGIRRSRIATDTVCPDETSDDPTSTKIVQPVQYDVQIDCYGPQSSVWADMLSTLLRNEVGVNALAPNCTPLYADDAQMRPLTDAEAQYEEAWHLDAAFEVNVVVTADQQYADALDLEEFVSVEKLAAA